MYGEKNTFEDAKTTVTEFLDDFYDDSEGNFNQAFLNLERRLQEYFGYEPRGPETLEGGIGGDGHADAESGHNQHDGRRFVVYNDGLEWARFESEQDAAKLVELYDGDHSVWYEAEKRSM
jgi:hypothetical protein